MDRLIRRLHSHIQHGAMQILLGKLDCLDLDAHSVTWIINGWLREEKEVPGNPVKMLGNLDLSEWVLDPFHFANNLVDRI